MHDPKMVYTHSAPQGGSRLTVVVLVLSGEVYLSTEFWGSARGTNSRGCGFCEESGKGRLLSTSIW